MSKRELAAAAFCALLTFLFVVFKFPLGIAILLSLLAGLIGSVIVCYVEEKIKK